MLSLLFFTETFATEKSQKSSKWSYELKAGVNIGGAVPMPMPVEIRSIESYNPLFNGSFSGEVTRYFGDKRRWALSTGLAVENKGMTTGAKVKNYSTEIINGGSKVAGYFTGSVYTEYRSTLLTLPLTALYRISSRWKVKAGGFLSYKLNGSFSGKVSDGYLRNNSPVGDKIEFKDGQSAEFNFNDKLSHFQYGALVGASWKAYKHFNVNADLSYSFKDIFKKDFTTVDFPLHPLYLNLGFSYEF